MIVWQALTVAVDVTAQNGMRQGIALGCHLPVAVLEHVWVLCRGDRVHHHRKITARGVFHANGHVHTACHQAVLLIFYRPRTHSHVGK